MLKRPDKSLVNFSQMPQLDLPDLLPRYLRLLQDNGVTTIKKMVAIQEAGGHPFEVYKCVVKEADVNKPMFWHGIIISKAGRVSSGQDNTVSAVETVVL